MNSFSDETFTKRFQAVKSLKLEAEPVGRTRETIDELKVFEKDAAIMGFVKRTAECKLS